MLKAQKRLTKREIKEDKFVTNYFKAQDFLGQYSRQILYGIGAVVVLWLAFYFISQNQFAKEQKAVVELTKAKIKYFENDYAGAVPLLRNIVDEYNGTSGGIEGEFYLANASFHLKKYDESVQYFKAYIADGDDEVLLSSAIAGIGACLEEQKDFGAAALKYEEAARYYDNNFMAPEQLYHAARCFLLAGNKDSARKLLDEVIEKYADSSIKAEAEILLAELAS